MHAKTLSRAVIDGDEHRGLPFAGGDSGHVGAPHLVHRLAGDGAIMRPWAPWRSRPLMHQQALLAHDPQHPARTGSDPGIAQAGPDLPVAFTMEGTVGKQPDDAFGQSRVGHRSLRSGTAARWARPGLGLAMPVDRRPATPPDAADLSQTVGACRGGRMRPAHRFDLRRRKGTPASRRSIFASSSSFDIVISPIFSRMAFNSRSLPSSGRVFSDAAPASRKLSRQRLRSAAVVPISRLTSSRSSPRRTRRTASSFIWADRRRLRGAAGLPSPAYWARSVKPALVLRSSVMTPSFQGAAIAQIAVSGNCTPGEQAETAISARYSLSRGAGTDELAHQQRYVVAGDVKQVSFVHVLTSAQPGSAHAAAIEVMGKRALYDLGAQLESRAGDTRFEPHAVVGNRATRCLVTTPTRKSSLFRLTNPGLPGASVEVFQDGPSVIAFVGHTFGWVLHSRRQIHCFERGLSHRQGLAKGRGVTLIGWMQFGRHNRACVQVDRMLGLVSKMGRSVLHPGDLGLGIALRNLILVRQLLALAVQTHQILGCRRFDTAFLGQMLEHFPVAFTRVAADDVAQRRVGLHGRGIHPNAVALHEAGLGDQRQNPVEDRRVYLMR